MSISLRTPTTASKMKCNLQDLSYFKHQLKLKNDKPENIAAKLRKKSWARTNI